MDRKPMWIWTHMWNSIYYLNDANISLYVDKHKRVWTIEVFMWKDKRARYFTS